MGRAGLRRAKREKEKSETVTYNLTKAQLDALVDKEVRSIIDGELKQAKYDAINTAMVLLFTIPLEVLMDHYWPKSYAKRLPEFTDYVLDYYQRWQNGELDMDKMKEDLWEYAGFRLEESEG